jgi:hypothetical protein
MKASGMLLINAAGEGTCEVKKNQSSVGAALVAALEVLPPEVWLRLGSGTV